MDKGELLFGIAIIVLLAAYMIQVYCKPVKKEETTIDQGPFDRARRKAGIYAQTHKAGMWWVICRGEKIQNIANFNLFDFEKGLPRIKPAVYIDRLLKKHENYIDMSISRTIFRLIADIGIIININPDGGFLVSIHDFIEKKEIPKHLNLKYSNENIEEFIKIHKICVTYKYRQEKQNTEEERNLYYKQEERSPDYVSRYKPNYKNKEKQEETKQEAEKEPSFEDFLKFFNSFGHFKAKL